MKNCFGNALWNQWRVVLALFSLLWAAACTPEPDSCRPPSVRFMGRCLPPCVEDGFDFCARPDGSVQSSLDGATDATIDGAASGAEASIDGSMVCPEGETRCTTGCVNLLSSVENCGRCANACNAANALSGCQQGACVVESCRAGFGDCDGETANGCETDTTMSADNCGRCGNRCTSPNGTSSCGRTGTGAVGCVVRCDGSSLDCDVDVSNGCEVNGLTDAINCGACGNVCPPVANGTPTCGMGNCGLRCNPGFHLINRVCVADGTRPQLLSPISLGDVTRRQPTLRWQLPAVFDGSVVDLCRDRACGQVIETIRSAATSTRPTLALPSNSVVFWRVRGAIGIVEDTTSSPVWLFHVPARDTAVDSSASPHLDVNGDGFDDVAIGAPTANRGGRFSTGEVRIFHGSGVGLDNAPSRILEGGAFADNLGYAVSSAGDVNGDGFGDLLVGVRYADPFGRSNAGAAQLYVGGPSGLGLLPAATIPGSSAGDNLGSSVAGVGDVNGDGYSDVVVGAWVADPGGRMDAGTATLCVGRADAMIVPTTVFEGIAAGDFFGVAVTGAGDVNGDGLSDIAIGASRASPGGRNSAGSVYVFLGRAVGVAVSPAQTLDGVAALDSFGRAVSSAYDANGDGYSDVIVGAFGASPGGRVEAGTASVFLGGLGGLGANPIRVFAGLNSGDKFGDAVAGAGDLNGDGFGDVVVGAWLADPGGRMDAGSVSIYLGSAMGPTGAPLRVLDGVNAQDGFGSALSRAGDVNGDGFADFLVGASTADPGGFVDAGNVGVYLGTVAGGTNAPTRVIGGSAANDGFGFSVAFLRQRIRSFRGSIRL